MSISLHAIAGVLIISPLWGIYSTVLFLQAWFSFITFWMCLIGLIRGKVLRKNNFIGLAASIGMMALMSVGLRLGIYILADLLKFGYRPSENIIYWVFAAIMFLCGIGALLDDVKEAWRKAMVPGVLETNILKKKLAKEIKIAETNSEIPN